MRNKWHTQIVWAECNKEIIYLKSKHIWRNSKEWDSILGLGKAESCHYPWRELSYRTGVNQHGAPIWTLQSHPLLTLLAPFLGVAKAKWMKEKKGERGEIIEIAESDNVEPCMLLRTGFYSEWDENPWGNSSREGKWSNLSFQKLALPAVRENRLLGSRVETGTLVRRLLQLSRWDIILTRTRMDAMKVVRDHLMLTISWR